MKYEALTEFCDLNMGQSPDSKTYNEHGDGMPFYQGNADFGEIHPETCVWCSKPVKVASEGDILISVRAPIGAMNIATETCCIGRGLAALTPKSNKCSQKYLYYALESKIDVLVSKGTGSTFKAISKKVLAETLIPSYTDEKQQQITDALSKIDVLITDRKQQLIEMDLLVKSRFIELFGDIIGNRTLPLIRLSELADIGSSKRIYANEYVESGIPFYRSKEIRELGTGLKPSVELFIKRERYDEIREKYGVPKVGDILIAAIGATIGYSWIVDTDSPFYYKDGNLIVLSIKDNVNPIFLNHAMGILIEDFKKKGVAGSAQLALTIEKLEKMMVVNPELELQNQFAAFVAQVDKSKYCRCKSSRLLQRVASI